MWDFIVKYWVQALFGAVLSLIGVVYRKVTLHMKKHEVLSSGVKALLHDQIVQAYNYFMVLGYCPIYDRENIESLFQEYDALDGNGTIAHLAKDLNRLPTEPPD